MKKWVYDFNKEKTDGNQNLKDLLDVVESDQEDENSKILYKYNQVLIDIIEKIQNQNKKNQLFINKAYQTLEDLKITNFEKKNYSTYNSKGKSSNPNKLEQSK